MAPVVVNGFRFKGKPEAEVVPAGRDSSQAAEGDTAGTPQTQSSSRVPMAGGAAADPSEGNNSKSYISQGGNENIPSPAPCQYPHVLLLEPRTASTPSSSPAPLQCMREHLCFHKEMEKDQKKTDCAVFSYLRALQITAAELLL